MRETDRRTNRQNERKKEEEERKKEEEKTVRVTILFSSRSWHQLRDHL